MKKILAIASLAAMVTVFFAACHKVEDLPKYEEGNSVALTASKSAVVATPADSLNSVIGFSWTSPNYATDTSNYKYILEIDSAGRNFSKKTTKTVMGALETGLTGKELNGIVLNYGFSLGVPYDMEARAVSSYGNNNERYTSNAVAFKVTPYNDPAKLTSEKTTVTGTLATASQPSNKFSWTPAF